MRTLMCVAAAGAIVVAAVSGCDQLQQRGTSAGMQRSTAARQEPPADIQRGAKALVGLQAADGSFPRAETGAEVAITALAGLALLEAGDGMEANPYAANINKATRYILENQNAAGMLGTKGATMYTHGFATLYLTQIYALTRDASEKKRVETALIKAVQLIEAGQNKDGGWRYTPSPIDADVSVTAGQLKALTAAQKAGIKVNQKVIDNAVQYVRSMQNADGGFRYAGKGQPSGWARSAAAVAVLLYTGAADDKTNQGMSYLEGHTKSEGTEKAPFYYYGNFYLAQALNLSPRGNSLTHDALVRSVRDKQDEGGLWHGEAGEAYATATALIVLEMKGASLPAFKGK